MHTYTHTWFLTPNCMNKFARSHATPSYICWWWKCSIDVTKKLYFLFWAARITSSGALPWILFDSINRIHVDLFQPVLPVYIFKIWYSPGSKVISSYGRTCWTSSEDYAPTWSAVLSMIPVSHQVFHTDRIHPVASRKWDLPHGDPPAEAMCFFACISVQQIDWSNMTKQGNISLIRNYIVCIWWSCGNKSLISACFVCQISVISPQAYPWLKAVVFHQYVKL